MYNSPYSVHVPNWRGVCIILCSLQSAGNLRRKRKGGWETVEFERGMGGAGQAQHETLTALPSLAK